MKPKELIESIQDDIRALRDSDNHVCPNDQDDTLECTCEGYDRVNDRLDELSQMITNGC